MSKPWAVYDFDGTVFPGQGHLELLIYLRKLGKVKLSAYFLIWMWFFLYWAGFVSNPTKVMGYAFSFLKGWNFKDFEKICEDVVRTRISPSAYNWILEDIKKRKENGQPVILLTSLISPLASAAGRMMGASEVISTKLEIDESGRFTGRVRGEAMFGWNKLFALRDYARNAKLKIEDAVSYGDHLTDLPVMEVAGKAIAINPSRGLLKEARGRGWEVRILK